VFAMGGPSRSDDASESGYLAVRAALANSVTQSARFIAEHGVSRESAPALVRFITQVASRFGFVVTEKAAAQVVPFIGAVSGAVVNYPFTALLKEIARGPFPVGGLKKFYEKEFIRAKYNPLPKAIKIPPPPMSPRGEKRTPPPAD